MKLWRHILTVLMLATTLTVTSAAAADDPATVIDTLEAALMAKNVDGAVALFTDDAMAWRTPPLPNTTGTYHGKAEVGGFWQSLIALNPQFETVGQRQVTGEQVTWTSSTGLDVWRQLGIPSLITRGKATVRGGKIAAIAISIPPESLAKVQTAMVASAPTSDPLAVVTTLDATLNAQNIEDALALFADDATVRQNPAQPGATGIYTGKAEVRVFLASIVAQNIHFDLTAPRQVVGEWVMWTNNTSVDPWRKLGIAPLQGQGDVTVHDGKIVSLTITLTPASMAILQRAMAASVPVASP